MENKINIAKLLKDCPKGMELDCTMYEDVYFDYVDELNIIHCYIKNEGFKTSITFNQHGTPNSYIKSKCVIFPKGKTTWGEFVPSYKFKDGDIVFSGVSLISIFKDIKKGYNERLHSYVSVKENDSTLNIDRDFWTLENIRFATEEEKQKLFDAIKANGYKWNAETKTLEKLVEPKFKVGNKIRLKNDKTIIETINYIYPDSYGLCSNHLLFFKEQDEWELVPNKFDINTLKSFNKVLVRRNSDNKWRAAFFSYIDEDFYSHCYKFVTIGGKSYPEMIPYEGNEHLCDTTDDCKEYYKTWK